MQTQMQKQKHKKMQNLHLFVSTAKPEGSSGGENEEQKRGVVVGAVHPSAALARQRVTALDILKGFNASTEYEVLRSTLCVYATTMAQYTVLKLQDNIHKQR